MADSGSGVKQFSGEMGQTTSEVIKDVKDDVGQMIEQGVQFIAGKQLTPQQIQQKQIEDQQKLAQARRKIKWYQDIAEAQKKVREEEKQKQLRRQQEEEQERQKKKMEEAQRKQPIPQPTKPLTIPEAIARTQAERSKGRGVGG